MVGEITNEAVGLSSYPGVVSNHWRVWQVGKDPWVGEM